MKAHEHYYIAADNLRVARLDPTFVGTATERALLAIGHSLLGLMVLLATKEPQGPRADAAWREIRENQIK